jgi:NCS1 family nucleobase:cation symporter-1
MFIHPRVLRHLFVVKAVYTTISLLGVLGWVISANGGKIGDFKYTTKQTQLLGQDLIWPMISAINSVMGALAPVLINQPDIARYGHSYGDVTWSQGVGIFTSKVLVMFISTATTAAATPVLGKSYWNVWDLCKLHRSLGSIQEPC